MGEERAVVIGAGFGGLAAAVSLAVAGVPVTLVESAPAAGGKARALPVGGAMVEAGPTVLTLRPVFDALFAAAGARLADYVTLRPAAVLARHHWPDGATLDLFADPAASADAVGRMAGAREAAGFRAFMAEAARLERMLGPAFMEAARPGGPLALCARIGLHRVADLLALRPYRSLWGALGLWFRDPRLRQLFGRYATYCGSSPFAAPATLMLVAAVEARGVWLVEGGVSALALALDSLAARVGVRRLYGATVARLLLDRAGAAGVELASGERLDARRVVANVDPAAIASGRLGPDAARAVPPAPADPRRRSLSALVWLLDAPVRGTAPERHNIFFSADYAAEFADLARGRPPADPTLYLCAQDAGDPDVPPPGARQRLQIILNAPADGDRRSPAPEELDQCQTTMLARLARSGLWLDCAPGAGTLLTPADFERRFPSTGGALYGSPSHGSAASFRRPTARTRIPGFYLAGGGCHPGPGAPMAALSGRLAASALLSDLASSARFHPAATPGGISTPSAATAATA
jgi:1-hydroxycarotenoid 3,4-desaturase